MAGKRARRGPKIRGPPVSHEVHKGSGPVLILQVLQILVMGAGRWGRHLLPGLDVPG